MAEPEAELLAKEAKCIYSCIPKGFIWYAVLAAITDVANGNIVPVDPDALIEEAKCLVCQIPEGMVPYAILVQVAKITGGGGSSCIFCEPSSDPSGTSPCSCAIWIRKDNGFVWYWESDPPDGPGWIPLIQ